MLHIDTDISDTHIRHHSVAKWDQSSRTEDCLNIKSLESEQSDYSSASKGTKDHGRSRGQDLGEIWRTVVIRPGRVRPPETLTTLSTTFNSL